MASTGLFSRWLQTPALGQAKEGASGSPTWIARVQTLGLYSTALPGYSQGVGSERAGYELAPILASPPPPQCLTSLFK